MLVKMSTSIFELDTMDDWKYGIAVTNDEQNILYHLALYKKDPTNQVDMLYHELSINQKFNLDDKAFLVIEGNELKRLINDLKKSEAS
jgi:hypothetical protein